MGISYWSSDVCSSDLIEAVKACGAKLICFTPALSLGKQLLRSGVDALVIEGMEAGGHIGPVSISVLAQEILPALADQAPVFGAGGIARGEATAAHLEWGARSDARLVGHACVRPGTSRWRS